MSRPYLVLTWPDGAAGCGPAEPISRGLAERGWRRAVDLPRLQVWRRADRPAAIQTAAAEGLVVIGRRIARRADAGVGRDLTPARRAGQLSAGGWGGYVALLRAPDTGDWWAFRDASGAMEALSWRHRELGVLASGLVDLPAGLLPPNLALDWAVIGDLLFAPAAAQAVTALDGVAVVCPGDAQPIGSGREGAVAVWRPQAFLDEGRGVGGDGPEHLRAALLATVTALLAPYGRVVTEASGGFDSSLVNAALARAGLSSRVAAALHYVGDRRESDERSWATEACRAAGLPIAFADFGASAADPVADYADLCGDARPPFAALDAPRDRDTAERLRGWEAEALVTGRGGDAIFFQMPTPFVAADLHRQRGWRAFLDPASLDQARWLRCSVWSLWRDAFGLGAAEASDGLAGFAGWAWRDRRPALIHPWLAGLANAPPGKRVQIAALIGSMGPSGASRRGQACDLVQPLLAQPMMELCLGIPSWTLVAGGRDRGLARAAFADWLPPAIVARRSKGALTSLYARRFALGLPALREHLLEGVLVGAGLLDGAAVDRALDADALIRDGDGLDLSRAAALESWVRHWQSRIPDAARAGRRHPPVRMA